MRTFHCLYYIYLFNSVSFHNQVLNWSIQSSLSPQHFRLSWENVSLPSPAPLLLLCSWISEAFQTSALFGSFYRRAVCPGMSTTWLVRWSRWVPPGATDCCATSMYDCRPDASLRKFHTGSLCRGRKAAPPDAERASCRHWWTTNQFSHQEREREREREREVEQKRIIVCKRPGQEMERNVTFCSLQCEGGNRGNGPETLVPDRPSYLSAMVLAIWVGRDGQTSAKRQGGQAGWAKVLQVQYHTCWLFTVLENLWPLSEKKWKESSTELEMESTAGRRSKYSQAPRVLVNSD